ncbi:MAG: twin-arginine translocase TatA/TatE family subunit [Planctomycetes bacterium]|nr:twin-arginine translocase TatA/TatE family subunit [Planctomycetota bacterium]
MTETGIILGFLERLGWGEITVILIVALVLFGGSQLPKLARRLGRGVHEFQEGIKGTKDAFEKGLVESDKPEGDKPKDGKPGDADSGIARSGDNGSKVDSPKA